MPASVESKAGPHFTLLSEEEARASGEQATDGISYTVRVPDEDVVEEMTVERSITVKEFVEKVRAEFFWEITKLRTSNLCSNVHVDLLAPANAERNLVEIVAPGSELLVNRPGEISEKHHLQQAPCFNRGDRVKIVGLQGRAELNGTTGRVIRWVDAKGRWEIKLDASEVGEPPIGLKPLNLERLPTKMKAGFLSAGLQDGRSKIRVALILLCDIGSSGNALRDRLCQLCGDAFEDRLKDAGIEICAYPHPKSVSERGVCGDDWFDLKAMRDRDAPEDIAGIAESMEIVDKEIDKIVDEKGVPPQRIGIVGFGAGGTVALHLAYGQGRYTDQLGAVACAGTFLAKDSILPDVVATRHRQRGGRESSPLFLSCSSENRVVCRSWVEATGCSLQSAGLKIPSGVWSRESSSGTICAEEVEDVSDHVHTLISEIFSIDQFNCLTRAT